MVDDIEFWFDKIRAAAYEMQTEHTWSCGNFAPSFPFEPTGDQDWIQQDFLRSAVALRPQPRLPRHNEETMAAHVTRDLIFPGSIVSGVRRATVLPLRARGNGGPGALAAVRRSNDDQGSESFREPRDPRDLDPPGVVLLLGSGSRADVPSTESARGAYAEVTLHGAPTDCAEGGA